jgi:hypothetical protein
MEFRFASEHTSHVQESKDKVQDQRFERNGGMQQRAHAFHIRGDSTTQRIRRNHNARHKWYKRSNRHSVRQRYNLDPLGPGRETERRENHDNIELAKQIRDNDRKISVRVTAPQASSNPVTGKAPYNPIFGRTLKACKPWEYCWRLLSSFDESCGSSEKFRLARSWGR